MASANETSDRLTSETSDNLEWTSYFPKQPLFNGEQGGKQRTNRKKANKQPKASSNRGGMSLDDEDVIIMRLVRDAREIVIDRKIEEIHRINREIERRYAEVENDKRAAESQHSHTDRDETKDNSDDTSNNGRQDDHHHHHHHQQHHHPHYRHHHQHYHQGCDEHFQGRGGNRRAFRAYGRVGRGHFRPRGGQQLQRSSEEVSRDEQQGPTRARGHFHGHQRARGTKFLTVSATSSSRDVQIGNDDQLVIKVDLSQQANVPGAPQQPKQNNHYQRQRSSTNEGEGDQLSPRAADHRPFGRGHKSGDIRFISTGQQHEGSRSEFQHDHRPDQHSRPRGSDHLHHHPHHQPHHHPHHQHYQQLRRGFRPPRRAGGRWPRGFLPNRDAGEVQQQHVRGEDGPQFRGGGFRGPPRGGRVFRRRGQNHGRATEDDGSLGQGDEAGGRGGVGASKDEEENVSKKEEGTVDEGGCQEREGEEGEDVEEVEEVEEEEEGDVGEFEGEETEEAFHDVEEEEEQESGKGAKLDRSLTGGEGKSLGNEEVLEMAEKTAEKDHKELPEKTAEKDHKEVENESPLDALSSGTACLKLETETSLKSEVKSEGPTGQEETEVSGDPRSKSGSSGIDAGESTSEAKDEAEKEGPKAEGSEATPEVVADPPSTLVKGEEKK